MAKSKLSGLGKGLSDLLNDNAPEINVKSGGKVVVRSPEGDKVMKTTSTIKDKKPKNRSVLQNYK